MYFKSNFFETVPGVNIHYIDEGQGTPLVFVPGWTFSVEVFEHQIPYFAKNYRVIAIDPRAHGKSTVTAVGIDYPTQTQDMAKLIRHLGLDNVILVGWGFGAYETWGLIRELGIEHIKGIFNMDASPKSMSRDDNDWVEDSMENLCATIQTIRTPSGFRELLSDYTKAVMVQRELTDEELEWILSCSHMPNYLAMAEYAYAITDDYRAEAQLADACPTCYTEMLVAEHWADVAVPYMAKLCPNTKVHVLGGHLAFWEHHELFNTILETFVRKAAAM